jgi:transaldolase
MNPSLILKAAEQTLYRPLIELVVARARESGGCKAMQLIHARDNLEVNIGPE